MCVCAPGGRPGRPRGREGQAQRADLVGGPDVADRPGGTAVAGAGDGDAPPHATVTAPRRQAGRQARMSTRSGTTKVLVLLGLRVPVTRSRNVCVPAGSSALVNIGRFPLRVVSKKASMVLPDRFSDRRWKTLVPNVRVPLASVVSVPLLSSRNSDQLPPLAMRKW